VSRLDKPTPLLDSEGTWKVCHADQNDTGKCDGDGPRRARGVYGLESICWPNGPVCPHCSVIGHAYYLEPKGEGRKTRTGTISQSKVWKCGSCRKQSSVIKGTCMEGSKIPVRKWVIAFHMLSAAKNGMSSHELGRQLDISHE
jgi:hypothetical protein